MTITELRITYDTLLGGYSIQRLTVGKRGARGWLRISNHPTLEAARAALKEIRT
jgi:hypothetical protein